MATQLVNSGTHLLSLDVDDEGHRTYTVAYLVKCESFDGPAAILTTAGLPQFGDFYTFKLESDPWAFCRPSGKITAHQPKSGEQSLYYVVEKTFSSKPLKRCAEQQFENPLLQPQRVSGTFAHATEEATADRFGNAIVNSAWEQVRGREVEFEVYRSEIDVEQNVADLEMPLLSRVNNAVNDAELWGLPRRCVRCVVKGWEQKFYGTCFTYYTRKFTFAAMVRKDPNTGAITSGWDRDLVDKGTKALSGKWVGGSWQLVDVGGATPSRFNPAHFIKLVDKHGHPTPYVLDGEGVPINKDVMGAISNITGPLVSPITVTTAAAHGLASDDVVGIYGFEGTNHAARGVFNITVISSTQFELYTIPPATVALDADLSTAGTGTYESGGFWVNVGASGPGKIHVEKYDEANMLLLGIPTDLSLTH